jgi:ATP-binding cassette subfamily B multidrug efflux pump
MKNKKRRLLGLKEWLFIIFAVTFVVVQVWTQLELPSITQNLIDEDIAEAQISYPNGFDWNILSIFQSNGLSMLFYAIVSIIASITASFFAARTAISIGSKLRNWVFKQVTSFSMEEYNKFGASTLITRNTNDIVQVQNFVYMVLRMLTMAPLMLVLGIIRAGETAPELNFIFWIAMPVILIMIVIIVLIASPLFKKQQDRLDQVNLVFKENLKGVRVIRAFNRSEQEKKRFSKTNKDHVDVARTVNRIMTSVQPLLIALLNLTTVAILFFGAVEVGNGTLQLGAIFAMLQYSMTILFSLVMVSMLFVFLPRAQASIKRINEVLKQPLKIQDIDNTKKIPDVNGVITFNNVTFQYPGSELPVLENISFTAEPGKITAIVGGTGSGKSTLVNLIPRFYDASDGEIYIDQVAIKDLSQSSLRSYIGFVPQKAALFSGTIKSNMLVGDKSANDEMITEALSIAQASEFVFADSGLEKNISQGGINLSGGQKQRLNIARALVRKPKVYIFDDTFSALDYETERKLRNQLVPYIKQSTVFIVAQRVSTIMDADQIIVLDEGKIVGIGRHEELLSSSTVYQEIVSSQITEEENHV